MPNFANNTNTDQQLAIAARAGDVDAFSELAKRFQPRLLNYLRHRCSNRAHAEDAIQETFLAAFQAMHRFDPRWQVSTWLFTIARRKAGKLADRERPLSEQAITQDTPADESRSAEQLAVDKEARSEIWVVAKDVLTPEQFTALWMYYVEGLDAKQAALVLDKSYASARAILARARHAMRPHLKSWQSNPRPASAPTTPTATSVRFAA